MKLSRIAKHAPNCKQQINDPCVRPQTVYIGKYGKIRCFGILGLLRPFSILLVNLGGLGVFPLDPPRNSTRFAAANASRALTAVRFRLATVVGCYSCRRMLLLSSAGRAAGMLGHRWRQAGGRPADGQHRPGGVAVGDLCTEALRKVRTPSVQALFGEQCPKY